MDTLESYRAKLQDFAEQVPQLLARHPETVEEARLIREHVAALENAKRFRLAVTGKIKQGKSTLINALIGRSLPTVGVNEATATLNFIGYGTGDDLLRIKVRWKNDSMPDEEHPLDFLTHVQGEESKPLAEQIEAIFLFAEAEFLRDVQLIDTPGEMGTLLSKINIKSDALIRVLPFAAEANDQDHLGEFGFETRPFGSGAYNSIAVIQMWEQHWPNRNPKLHGHDPFSLGPFENALEYAREQRRVLGDAVSDVLPVSGLLELFSKEADEPWLNDILELVHGASKDDLIIMLKSQKHFCDDEDDYKSAPVDLRQQVWSGLKQTKDYSAAAWPTLKMAIWAVHRHSPTNAEALREHLHVMSNIDSLNEILKKRFFALSELIQTGSQLNKVLAPCDAAIHRLRVKRETNQHLLEDGFESLRALEAIAANNATAKQDVQSYIQKMQSIAEKEVAWIGDTCRQISALNTDIKNGFDTIQKEIAFLHVLDGKEGHKNLGLDGKGDGEDLSEIRRIFGQFGIELYQRLGCDQEASLQVMRNKAWDLHKRWRIDSYRLPQDMQEALIYRLDLILDVLDKAVENP